MQTDRWVPPLASKESRPAAARTRPGGARGGAACREVRSRRNTARAHRGGRTPTTPSARVATFRVRDPPAAQALCGASGAMFAKQASIFLKFAACTLRPAWTSSQLLRAFVEALSNSHAIVTSHADPVARRCEWPLAGPGRGLDRSQCQRANHSLGLAGRRFRPGRAARL
jgi:hypothetical protein